MKSETQVARNGRACARAGGGEQKSTPLHGDSRSVHYVRAAAHRAEGAPRAAGRGRAGHHRHAAHTKRTNQFTHSG